MGRAKGGGIGGWGLGVGDWEELWALAPVVLIAHPPYNPSDLKGGRLGFTYCATQNCGPATADPLVLATSRPGAVLVGLSIGAGELVMWPWITAKFGASMAWAAALGVFLQLWINLEIGRWTIVTGEAPYTGFARAWMGFIYILLFLTFAGLFLPGWARVSGAALKGLIFGPDGSRRGLDVDRPDLRFDRCHALRPQSHVSGYGTDCYRSGRLHYPGAYFCGLSGRNLGARIRDGRRAGELRSYRIDG